MPFSNGHYDPVTLALMTRAFDEAWAEVQSTMKASLLGDGSTTRTKMALRIMAAARDGVRDLERMKRLAIRAVDGTGPN